MTLIRTIAPDSQRLYQDVAWLTQLRPYRNYQQVKSLDQTAHYIRQAWQAYGYEVHYQSYEARGALYHNVCTAYNLEAEERLVIGAHYDVDGNQPGADDNASAVAGLLELSRLLQTAKPKLRLGIEFVAFTLEESPFFYTDLMGSAVHAQTLREAEVPVRLMICLEMIGYFSDQPGSQKFPHPDLAHYYPDTGNFIALVGRPEEKPLIQQFKNKMLAAANLPVESFCAPPEQVFDITRSDHFNYWKAGYPAIMVSDTSFLRNPHYHKPSDTIETLNFEKMTAVVQGVFAAVLDLAS